ncbi:ABC transporter permease subunit [Virgibacillus halodenitrificans]|uniref:ABC transporter permease subunit n=1 Tax=Virgibacillus halodenitrificans TaxID=1482 RepID=A0ABR7VLZ7_VIRHA|nr:ABC transporter permease subunit [Virgibacillus halodenitrificans]MBD1222942.1 ABC transporter permease subunit [Virgibacillus halodenitrificans]
MKYFRMVFFYILGIISILIISVLPNYFSSLGFPEAPGFLKQVTDFLVAFVNPDSWLYAVEGSPGKFSVLDVLWEPFLYSAKILLGALLLGVGLAFILAFSANFLPKHILQPIKRVLDFLESVPDLVFATLLQVLVIYVYKASGVHLFAVAGYMEDKVYLAPILTLSILPMVTLFKLFLLLIEEEFIKEYVVFLKSKGISSIGILIKHVLKNIMPSSFYHLKLVIWGTLSSQFIIERVFNVHGLTFFLLESFTPMTIAFSLILIFTPFYFFFQFIDLWIGGDKVASKQFNILKGAKQTRRGSFSGWMEYVGHRFLYKMKNVGSPFKKMSKQVFRLVTAHIKNWKFALGISFFIVLIGYSFLYSVMTDNLVEQATLLYEEDGVTIRSTPPHPPSEAFLFGSTELGFSIADQLIIGAKYTLIFGLLIALLRVLGGLLFGIVFAFSLPYRLQKAIEKLTDSIHFLPLSLIAYILLRPILMPTQSGFAYTFTERIILEITILTVLVIPLTMVLIGKEMNRVLQYEFIASAKVLGGGSFHLFWRHILPHIGPRLTILFGQQFIQVLLVFIHLGVFNLFFGGTKLSFDPMMGDPPSSLSYEWSGMIGAVARGSISSGHYWYLWTLVAFVLSIFAMQLIIQGVKEVQQVKVGVIYKVKKARKKKNGKASIQTPAFSKKDFKQIGRREA